MDLLLQFGLLALGFVLLGKGADWFVEGAAGIAAKFGIPQLVIGLTIVAMGTSAPEAAVSIAASLKGSADITIGNVVGSCVFNIFFVLGVCSLVRPMEVSDISLVQLSALVASGLLVWLFTATKTSINRIEGIVMCLCYIAFITYLVLE